MDYQRIDQSQDIDLAVSEILLSLRNQPSHVPQLAPTVSSVSIPKILIPRVSSPKSNNASATDSSSSSPPSPFRVWGGQSSAPSSAPPSPQLRSLTVPCSPNQLTPREQQNTKPGFNTFHQGTSQIPNNPIKQPTTVPGSIVPPDHFGLVDINIPIFYLRGPTFSIATGPWTHQVKDSNLLPTSIVRVNPSTATSSDFIISRLVCDPLYRMNGLVFLGAIPSLYADEKGCVVLPSLKITKAMLPGRTKGFDFRVLYTYLKNGVEVEHVLSASFAIWANAYQSGFPLQEHSQQIEKRTQINRAKKRKAPASPSKQ